MLMETMLPESLSRLFGRLGLTERRRYQRVYDKPIKLKIEGHKYQTLDWSIGGCKIIGFHREVAVGSTIDGRIGPVNGSKGGDFRATVVRANGDGEVALQWREMSSATYVGLSTAHR